MTSGFYQAVQASVETEEGRIDVVERLASMSKEEVDDLPYGFVVLDESGTILLYNRYESSLSRLAPESVVGKNWFKEVAPCTRVEAFYGRFRALVTGQDRVQETFRFRFYFMHGLQDVTVHLVKAPASLRLPIESAEGSSRVFMTVVRRAVRTVDEQATSRADGDLQQSLGTIGGILPVVLDSWPDLLARLGPRAAGDLGEHVGRAISLVVESEASVASSEELPKIFGKGVLDGIFSRTGLGRVRLDGASFFSDKRVVCELRPCFEAPNAETADFYAALLAATVGTCLGRPYQAHFTEAFTPTDALWRIELDDKSTGL